MTRDQRVADNFSLLYAQEIANASRQPLITLFKIDEHFPNFNHRNATFMFTNLVEVEKNLAQFNIPMIFSQGGIDQIIPKIIDEYKISVIITDFSPLKVSKTWLQRLRNSCSDPIIICDNHNIVPIWVASNKQEYSARTLRPKLHKHLDEFFTPIPNLQKHKYDLPDSVESFDWNQVGIKPVQTKVKEITWLNSGEEEAKKILANFIDNKLSGYNLLKNDPTENVVSNLSPYLHFGQISAHRVAWEVTQAKTIAKTDKDKFIEELVVRKELSDNFCFYNEQYDSFSGFHSWAQESLSKHLIDKREYVYNLEVFENAKTHDDLWNAAQNEMVLTGKMHGYLRMYWAKKILEWTETPSDAQKIAIQLNDTYELDGRDPNGYTGIAWSIGGVHDRPWGPERPIFGFIRYMNFAGAKRKFNVQKYIEKIATLKEI